MKTALLIFLAIPGSGALLVLALRELVKAVRRDREDEEGRARRIRLMNEYAVPDFAVEEVRVMRTAEVAKPVEVPRELPEITSRYRDEVSR